jgi:hypothetical protein
MDCRVKPGNDDVTCFTASSSDLVIARSQRDEAIQIPAQAIWIASLTLAMTHPLPSSPPGSTRWSMLTCGEANDAANLRNGRPAWIAGS